MTDRSRSSRRPKSRRHHLVPAFYLAYFTDTGERTGYVSVANLERRKTYRGKPDRVAYRNNFNTLESEDVDPDGMEKMFSDVERAAAPAIARAIESRVCPAGDDLEAILMLLAIQVVRAPSSRHSIARSAAEISQRMLEIVTSSPEIFDSYSERMKSEGVDPGDFRDMRDYVRSTQVELRDNDWLKAMSLEPLELVTETMLDRVWYAIIIPDDSDFSFITTEHPLKLRWADNRLAAGPYPPGFGLDKTRVTFPLGPCITLCGEYGGPAGFAAPADIKLVATMNSNTILNSVEIYSSGADFVWSNGDSVCRGADPLFDAMPRIAINDEDITDAGTGEPALPAESGPREATDSGAENCRND